MVSAVLQGFDVAFSRLVPLFQRLNGWRLWTVFTAGVVVAVEIVVSGMELLLKGTVTWDYLLTGLVAAVFAYVPARQRLLALISVTAVLLVLFGGLTMWRTQALLTMFS